ncbi:MFS transporter [Nocardiopsis valliformis]|uniref:MFS transporter n=1 Tax=Nocardiopsis valliformis TaxID=239974 RepID=UPI000345BE7C|nr:MFS transporter [Nocardiopsis valliformis]
MSTSPSHESTEPGQDTKRTRLWEAVGWLGVGMVVGTVLLTFLVVWRWENTDFGFALLVPVEGRWVWQVPLMIAVILAVIVFLTDREQPNPDPEGPVTPGFFESLGIMLVALLFVLWMALPRSSFVFTSWLFDEQYGVIAEEVAYWGISVSLLPGIVLLLASHRWPRTRPRRRSLPLMAVGVVLAMLTGFLLSAVAVHQPTRHSFLAGEVAEPAPVPDHVSRVGWTWEPPEDIEIRAVEPGSHGPIVALSDGVIALEGPTGEERWSFRHPHSSTESTIFTHEGLVRVVRYPRLHQLSTDEDRVALVTDLDTVTGEIVEQSVRPFGDLEEPDDVGQMLARTPDLTLYAEKAGSDGSQRIIAREGVSGEELWTYAAEDEIGRVCEESLWSASGGSLLHGGQVLLPLLCADSAESLAKSKRRSGLDREDWTLHSGLLVSLDPMTGARNWSYEWEDIAGYVWTRSGGPVMNEGAHPVVAFTASWENDELLLDPRDGTEVGMAPERMTEEEFHDFDVLTADTGGMVICRYREDGTLEFQRVSASGDVVDVAEIPGHMSDPDQEWAFSSRTTVLERGVVLPGLEGEYGEEGDWSASFVLTAPFGQSNEDSEVGASRRIPVEDGLELPWQDHRYSHLEPHMAPLPLPGAVVVHTTNGEGTDAPVHGLVP